MPSGIYIRTNKHKQALRVPHEGMKGHKFSQETRLRMSKARENVKVSLEHLKKLHEGRRGKKPWNWIKDRTLLKIYGDDNKDRRSAAYGNWRKEVWLRDNFKCRIENKDCNGRIEAHHILSWKEYPELRYIINNGITLCHAHHPRKRADEQRLAPIFKQLLMQTK